MDTIEINIKTNAGQAAEQTESLRAQVRSLRKEMEQTAVGSAEYEAALKKLSQATFEYREQQELVKNSAGDLGIAFSNLQSVASNIVAGFSAVNAATQLLGSNNEDLQKSMLKLQQGMALVQGLKGLEGVSKSVKNLITSVKAMIISTKTQTVANTALATSEKGVATATNIASAALKGFKSALASTGIGLLVIAAGALITNLDKIGKIVGLNIEPTTKYAGANDRLKKSFETQNEEIDKNVRLMEANGASALEIIKYKKKETEAQIAATDAAIANLLVHAELEKQNARSAKQMKEFEANLKVYTKEHEALEKSRAELIKIVQKLSIDETVQIVKDKKTQADAAKAAANKSVEAAKHAAADTSKIAEKTLKDILNKYKTTLNAIRGVQDNVFKTDKISEINAFKLLYGVDPSKLNSKLKGIFADLVKSAKEDLVEERDKALSTIAPLGDIGPIMDSFNAAFKDLENLAGADVFSKKLDDNVSETLDSAKQISNTYIESFDNLKLLYNQGIISEQEYYAGLKTARDKYYKESNDLMQSNVYLSNMSEEEKYLVKYNLQVKDLNKQKEINDVFATMYEKENQEILTDLESTLIEAETLYGNTLNSIATDQQNWAEKNKKYSILTSLFGTTDLRAEETALKAKHDAYVKYHESLVIDLNSRYANNLIAQEEYNNAMSGLEADRIAEETEYTNQSKALKEELVATELNTTSSILSAFAGLTDSINSLSEAQLSEYDRQLEAGEITQEKYDKLKKKALKTQASLQIATTIMQTGAGIATAWARAMELGPITGPIVAGVESAALITNMVAQIDSIKSALASGLSNSLGSSSTPDTSMTLQSSDAYANQVSDDTTADLQENAQKNSKVYVTSTDISKQQDKDKVTVTTSTF